MAASIRTAGCAVLLLTAGMAASCGGDVTGDRALEEGSGGSAVGDGGPITSDAGGRAGSTLGGSGGSRGSLVGDGGVSLTDGGSRAGSASGGGGGESVDVELSCNDIFYDAEPVTLSYVPEEPPTAIGGTPVPGRYHMTRFELFTGVDGPTGGETWDLERRIDITMLEDGSAEMASMEGDLDGEMMIAYQWNETLTFDGNSFTSTPTCRTYVISISAGIGLYSATADQLVIMRQAPERGGTWVYTYTLQ